jgi:hypothetical protein
LQKSHGLGDDLRVIADEGVVGLLLAAWGTTPGEWLLNMAVERQDGTAIDFSSALRRSFAVWLRGALGGGLPVVSLIAMVLAWNRLRDDGQTSWDRDGGFVVRHGEVGFWRGLAAVGAFLAIAAVWLALERALT